MIAGEFMLGESNNIEPCLLVHPVDLLVAVVLLLDALANAWRLGEFPAGILEDVPDRGEGGVALDFGGQLRDADRAAWTMEEDVNLRILVDRHGLAVSQLKALIRLQRARKGVPKVHRSQQRLLPQVRPDALEHRVHAPLNDLVRNRIVHKITFDQPSPMRFHQVEQRGIMD